MKLLGIISVDFDITD